MSTKGFCRGVNRFRDEECVQLTWVDTRVLEGLATAYVPEGIRLRDRLALQPAEILVIWTAPPGVQEWEEAMVAVAPKKVALDGKRLYRGPGSTER
jgi:hypothetical protein